MDKKTKKYSVIAGVIGLVVIVGAALVMSNSEMLQGRFPSLRTLFPSKVQTEGYFKDYKSPGTVLTAVASPVTSVVVSDVTSPGGTSQVASAVTSAVGSKVAVNKKMTSGINVNSLPQITAKILTDVAKKDMQKNQRKYQLSNKEKYSIIKLYEKSKKIQ